MALGLFFQCSLSLAFLSIPNSRICRILSDVPAFSPGTWEKSNLERQLHFSQFLGSLLTPAPSYYTHTHTHVLAACLPFHRSSKFVQMVFWIGFFLNNSHCEVGSSLLLPTLTRTASVCFPSNFHPKGSAYVTNVHAHTQIYSGKLLLLQGIQENPCFDLYIELWSHYFLKCYFPKRKRVRLFPWGKFILWQLLVIDK